MPTIKKRNHFHGILKILTDPDSDPQHCLLIPVDDLKAGGDHLDQVEQVERDTVQLHVVVVTGTLHLFTSVQA
jgi:hypothetical protein